MRCCCYPPAHMLAVSPISATGLLMYFAYSRLHSGRVSVRTIDVEMLEMHQLRCAKIRQGTTHAPADRAFQTLNGISLIRHPLTHHKQCTP